MRNITEEERLDYDRHGVVHLPGLLDDDWLARLQASFAQEISADQTRVNFVDFKALTPMIEASGAEFVTPEVASASGRFCISSFNWRRFPALGALCCGPPLPETVACLMQSRRINFYGEQLFLKEAGSLHRTAFHQDMPYFHVTGNKCCTVWIPLDTIEADNGMMGYVKGSHRWRTHAANGFVTQTPLPGSPLPQLPDIEGTTGEYDIVYYPAQPGDVIIHHANTVHGATGNSASRDRRAVSLHYLGDDVRYREPRGRPWTRESPLLSRTATSWTARSFPWSGRAARVMWRRWVPTCFPRTPDVHLPIVPLDLRRRVTGPRPSVASMTRRWQDRIGGVGGTGRSKRDKMRECPASLNGATRLTCILHE